jgi:hypothetical protein
MAGTLAVALPGGVASAKKPKPVTGTCNTVTGDATSQTLENCTDGADTGGSGTSTTTSETLNGNAVSGTDSVVWNTGSTSLESFSGKLLSGKKDKCTAPVGYSNVYEVKEKGKVTGGTATDLVGGKTKTTACVFSGGSGILVTGSSFTF